MPIQFMTSPKYLLTSESVTEGHPDKLCDQISDAVLDEAIRQDPTSRVACETLVTTGMVLLAGEITTKAYVECQKVVRDVLRDVDLLHVERAIVRAGRESRGCGTS